MRAARLVLLPLAGVTALIGAAHVGAAPEPPPAALASPAGAPLPAVPTTTAPTTTIPGATTTVAGDPAGTTATTTAVSGATTSVPTGPTVPTPPRSGAVVGDLDKGSGGELWSVRQMATAIAIAIAGLVAVGFVYGRLRSIGPRVSTTDLVRRPD